MEGGVEETVVKWVRIMWNDRMSNMGEDEERNRGN